ncbi:hypothetical protein [Gordonia sp. NPDC058843]|uniref:hypothetical protein n=1 Tax=Gordonia sp. NPDC058843 TaxID=3346648 RepID=UPI003692507A
MDALVTYEECADQWASLIAEAEAIRDEHPRHNVDRPDPVALRQWRAVELARAAAPEAFSDGPGLIASSQRAEAAADELERQGKPVTAEAILELTRKVA